MKLSTATCEFIKEHLHDDVKGLALQARKYPDVDMPAAITQIAGRQAAADKIPSWSMTDDLLYPKHLSMEQCSSEATASYKASLLKGDTFADLTGGFGIDCAFISRNFTKAVYVERQTELCDIAKHNFPLLGLNHIQVVNSDGVEYLKQMKEADCIFLDPARRNEHGGKTVAISDCEPDAVELSPLLLNKAKTTMIKLSPMLDLSLALHDLPRTGEVHIISASNECKELLLILNKVEQKEVPIHCINISRDGSMQKFSFTRKEEQNVNCTYAKQTGKYLYEPNASILKAGAYKSIAKAYELDKLHPNSHLYTSDTYIPHFPGRVFKTESTFTLNKKEVKEHLNGTEKANITVRNFPLAVAELRKRLKLKDGGDIYIFATTLSDERKVLIKCLKP